MMDSIQSNGVYFILYVGCAVMIVALILKLTRQIQKRRRVQNSGKPILKEMEFEDNEMELRKR